MNKNYLCPECRGHLNVSDRIVFSTRKPDGSRGLVFLSPKIGDYSIVSHEEYKLSDGDKLDFYCPLCQANLVAEKVSGNLGRVIMIDENKKESRILFSEIVGQRCTFKISEENVEAYGDNLDEYTNFFGEMPKY